MGGGMKQKHFKLLVIVCTVQTFKCYMQDEIRTGLFLRGGTGVEGEGGGINQNKDIDIANISWRLHNNSI